MNKITVFTTIYNVAKYLPRFFECMSKQTFSDFMLLLVDDGSNDGSYEICKQRADRDERIKLIRTEHHGISAARNLALNLIESPFAASADGDDIYEKDYLLHLVEAQEKYAADLVISRVAYRNEAYKMTWENPIRGELVIDKSEFRDMLPLLLEDARLNFLYGKLYRTELLRGIHVEEDVEQGSDTMINCQFVEKANRIVCIDDMDVNWIQYSSRSVTSYKGRNMYHRMFRIQDYLIDSFQNSGYLNSEMQRVIDKRIFLSLRWSLARLPYGDISVRDALSVVSKMAHESIYIEAYERQKKRGNLEAYGFHIMSPEEVLPSYVENQIDHLKRELESARNDQRQAISQKKELETAISALEQSVSFRIGRAITYPGRQLRDFLKKASK